MALNKNVTNPLAGASSTGLRAGMDARAGRSPGAVPPKYAAGYLPQEAVTTGLMADQLSALRQQLAEQDYSNGMADAARTAKLAKVDLRRNYDLARRKTALGSAAAGNAFNPAMVGAAQAQQRADLLNSRAKVQTEWAAQQLELQRARERALALLQAEDMQRALQIGLQVPYAVRGL